jgi:hypothetical protein
MLNFLESTYRSTLMFVLQKLFILIQTLENPKLNKVFGEVNLKIDKSLLKLLLILLDIYVNLPQLFVVHHHC